MAEDSEGPGSALQAEVAALRQQVREQGRWLARLLRGSVLVVDAGGAGLFRTIAAAVAAARPGDTVVVRPGEYRESLRLTKAVTVLGPHRSPSFTPWDEAEDDALPAPFGQTFRKGGEQLHRTATIHGSGDEPTVLFDAAATLSGFTLRQSSPTQPCVMFAAQQHGPVLSECDVRADRTAAVAIGAHCGATVRHCRVCSAAHHGIVVGEAARPVIANNEVLDAGQSNVVIERAAEPIVVCNRIVKAGRNGVQCAAGARGLLLHNDISHSECANVDVAAEASPRLEHNTIHASRKCGVCFAAGALGWLLENDVFRNGYANVGVLEGARPVVQRNLIHNAAQYGAVFKPGSAGVLEDNHVYANTLVNVCLEEGATVQHRSNQTLSLRPTLLAVDNALATDAMCALHLAGDTLPSALL